MRWDPRQHMFTDLSLCLTKGTKGRRNQRKIGMRERTWMLDVENSIDLLRVDFCCEELGGNEAMLCFASTLSQPCHSSTKANMDNMCMNECGYLPLNLYYSKIGGLDP